MADHGRIWFSFNAGKWSSTSEPWFLQGLWNPRRGITLALLLLRLTGTCMVSLVETKRGRPLEFNHQWIRCRKNQTIPPLTPSSCNTTNSCSYNRHEASLDLGIFAQISKVMSLKIRMHFVWNTQQCFSKSPIPKFLVFGTKLWATTRLFGSVFPASTWMGLYLASSCPGNSGNRRVRQSSH